MVILVGAVELLVRHADAVVVGLRGHHVQVTRRLFSGIKWTWQTRMRRAYRENATPQSIYCTLFLFLVREVNVFVEL